MNTQGQQMQKELSGQAIAPAEVEPIISDEWDGTTTVTYPWCSYTIDVAPSGAFVGDYQIFGPDGFYSDGFDTLKKAISRIRDREEF